MRLSPSLLSFTIAALSCPTALGQDVPARGTEARTESAPPDAPSKAEPPPTEDAEEPASPGEGQQSDRTAEDRSPQAAIRERDATESKAETPAAQPPPTPVEETSEQQARAAFLEGDRMYLEGDYSGAVEAFERAYSLSGRIEMLFNLANAHERLGQYERASVALRGYIPHSPPEHRPALERRLARFEERAQQRRQREEKTAKVVQKLKDNPRPFPVERSVGIGLVTLGGASLITGIGFGISALSARSNLKENCADGESGRLCSPDAEKDLERDRTHSIVSDVATLAGVVGVAVGTVFLIRSKRKEKRDLELDVGVGPSHVTLGGRF